MLAPGREGQVVVKLSGYIKFAELPHPFADIWPYIEALVETFGLETCV